jgi:hypothetical protein
MIDSPYVVRQSVTKTFGYNDYIRVQIDNIPMPNNVFSRPLILRIGNMAIEVTKTQLDHIAIGLQMDETSLNAIRLLRTEIIRDNEHIKNDLVKLCEL